MGLSINNILDELSEIDAVSAKILQDSHDEKNKYAEYIAHEKTEFDASLNDEIEKELADYRAKLDTENVKQLEDLKKKYDLEIEKLSNKYNKEKTDAIASEIFDQIIKE